MPARPLPPRLRQPLVLDGLLAVTLAAVAILAARVAAVDGHTTLAPIAVGLLLVEHLPLVARRRHPIVVWGVAGLAAVAYGIPNFPDPPLAFGALVALYSAAAHTNARVSRRIAVVTAVAVVAGLMADVGHNDASDWAVNLMAVSMAWLVGENQRARAEREEGERDAEARRAVIDERLRIARELHDVVAHHVSVVAIQAEAAQALLPDDPARAATVLPAIGGAARDALGELRRVLGVLRQEAVPGGDREPQPGLGDVAALAEQVQRAGVPVVVSVEGRPQPVSAGVDLCAYRIVQEALTNVMRHAGPARARVVLRYDPSALDVEVSDDGRGAPAHANGHGGGHGLLGMRERVAAFGGRLDAGPGPAGGFNVRAHLPL